MSDFPKGNLKSLPTVKRVVHKRSFLKSVQWAFSLTASQDSFVKSLGTSIQNKGFVLDSDYSIISIVSGIKDQVTVLANNCMLVISCPGSAYNHFDYYLPKIIEILESVEESGGNQITSTICLKTNSFEIDKEKLDVAFNASEINKLLFSEEFLNDGANSLFKLQGDGSVLIQRHEKDTVSKYIVELSAGVLWGQKFIVSEALSIMKEINNCVYSAWSYAMNPKMIQWLDE